MFADFSTTPVVKHELDEKKSFSVADVALWLWGFWDRTRGPLFRSALQVGKSTDGNEWTEVEHHAARIVEEIIAEATDREIVNEARESWRL